MMSNLDAPQEREIALIIYSENPQAIVKQIANLTSIANCRLLLRGFQTIHDFYFDTPDRALQSQRLALRIREIDSKRLITLKGPSQSTDWGGVKRSELETPWSQNELTRVIKELKTRSIKILPHPQDFDLVNPLNVMISIGLEVVQDRETHRQVRSIIFEDGERDTPALAELAIDSVIYHLGNKDIYHYEVEIEAKQDDGITALKMVFEKLIAMYGPVLRRWEHGKIATGKAIQKLLSEGALIELLDIKDNLKPAAYDKIDYYLKSASI